nr:MAG TPA: hypothetical protein [Caudoviricetes sp.]
MPTIDFIPIPRPSSPTGFFIWVGRLLIPARLNASYQETFLFVLPFRLLTFQSTPPTELGQASIL